MDYQALYTELTTSALADDGGRQGPAQTVGDVGCRS